MKKNKQENLTSFKAEDTNGGTVKIYGRVDPKLKEWLKSLPEGESYHVRQAVREYYKKIRGVDNEVDNLSE